MSVKEKPFSKHKLNQRNTTISGATNLINEAVDHLATLYNASGLAPVFAAREIAGAAVGGGEGRKEGRGYNDRVPEAIFLLKRPACDNIEHR